MSEWCDIMYSRSPRYNILGVGVVGVNDLIGDVDCVLNGCGVVLIVVCVMYCNFACT